MRSRRLAGVVLILLSLVSARPASAQGLPDLVIESVALEETQGGARLQIWLTINNHGQAAAGPFSIAIGGPDFSEIRSAPALNSGGSLRIDVEVRRPVVPPFGGSVTAMVDPTNALAESDESNNYASAALAANAEAIFRGPMATSVI